MKKYRSSPLHGDLRVRAVASPGVARRCRSRRRPGCSRSPPDPLAADVERRARVLAGALLRRRPSGAEAGTGIVVFGTTDIVSVSLADAGRRRVRRRDRDRLLERRRARVVDRRAGQRRVRVREREVDRRVRARARAARTASTSRRRVKSAGSVSVTVPLCVDVDQLWTSTGSVIVSPMPIDCTAAERPSRSACGAVSSSQLVELGPLAPALEAALDGRDDADDVVRVAGRAPARVRAPRS